MSSIALALVVQTGENSTFTYVALLVAMALLPFFLALVTSFAKLIVVGGLLRQALGTPQIPPTSVLTGLALILTVYIMSPTVEAAWETYQADAAEIEGAQQTEKVGLALIAIDEHLGAFLERHTDQRNERVFADLRERLKRSANAAAASTEPVRDPSAPAPDPSRLETGLERMLDLVTRRAPAFLLTELTEAFQIGFLIFIPFLVIDLVVSNVLLAMGMHMLTPVTVSLPLKLLLFVLADGWRLVLQGLVLGYT